MVADPAEYKWSSYRYKAEGVKDAVVDFDKTYMAFGKELQNRQMAYAQYVFDTIAKSEIMLTRDALQKGQLTGDERFCREVSQGLSVRISNIGPGRPKKVEN